MDSFNCISLKLRPFQGKVQKGTLASGNNYEWGSGKWGGGFLKEEGKFIVISQ
jgi:hypothetical protein